MGQLYYHESTATQSRSVGLENAKREGGRYRRIHGVTSHLQYLHTDFRGFGLGCRHNTISSFGIPSVEIQWINCKHRYNHERH
jgi:hypothetical protein